MKLLRILQFITLLASLSATQVFAADPAEATSTTWRATSLIEAIAYMLIFAFIGIGVAVVGYKIFDKCTPGDLSREILENKNVAAAIVAAAVILGVCIIVATAMTS